MMKSFKKLFSIFVVVFALFVGANAAEAFVLSSPYTLTNVVENSLTQVTVSGTVTPLPGQQPQNAQAYFKTNIAGQPAQTQHPNLSIQSNGNFQAPISGLSCGQTYEFRLYQTPPEAGITYISQGQSGVGFQYQIPCIQVEGQGDIMTTYANPEYINGVNWGTIISSDNSISFSGAHLIPIAPTNVTKYFQIEYGYGIAGQASYSNVVGYLPIQSANGPNYNFNATIPNLTPNTDYYFTIFECASSNISDGCTNLFTYGFAPTDLLGGNDVTHSFPQENSVLISGHLETQNGYVITNLPIEIIIKDMSGTEMMAAETVTGPQSQIANGYFEHLFFGLTNAGLVAGQQYTYTIVNQSTGVDLTPPHTFTMPAPSQGGGGGGGNTQTQGPEYNGLVACGEDPANYDCDFDAFLETVNRVVNFLIVFIAFPFVAIVIAWAGILLLTSGGSSGARDKAKEMIGKVIIGLIVALLAWVIIKLVLVVFGYTPEGPLWGILGTEPPQ